MIGYVQRRLLATAPVVLGVATATFVLLNLLPGDPVQAMLAQSGASAETVASVRSQLRLDDPLPLRYLAFLGQLARGDLGRSIASGERVGDLLASQLPATLQLAAAALLVALVVGCGLGVLAARSYGGWVDRAAMVASVLGASVPPFWLGLLFILVLSFQLRLLPATGTAGLERLVMPALVLGLGAAASLARVVRASLLEALAQDYVRTARAKGLPERLVVARHALRGSLAPVLALLGVQLGWLLAGTVVTETVFSRQGIGRLVVSAVEAKDFPVVQGVVLVVALACVLLNLLVDLAYAAVDPRLRQR